MPCPAAQDAPAKTFELVCGFTLRPLCGRHERPFTTLFRAKNLRPLIPLGDHSGFGAIEMLADQDVASQFMGSIP